ncbi:MAG: hypothetical protein SPI15_10965 [Candidatus Faecousia sp.]|nr:hypothetical protein [Clostridiales bacterium]MDY6181352.1 hypothetical protein [Candidatus Faecousia sp.]
MKAITLLESITGIRDKYILEAHEEPSRQRKRPSRRKFLLIAAIIALMLLLVGCVAYVLSLRDLKIADFTPAQGQSAAPGKNELISLQGFAGSPGYQAHREWLEFREGYDPDGNLLNLSHFDDYVEPEEYRVYTCYTREMVEKVDELCQKYDLNRITKVYVTAPEEEVYEAVGIPGVLNPSAPAEVQTYGIYYTSDGSFHLEGDATLTGADYPIDFQYSCVRKDSFCDYSLNVGDIDRYEQWRISLDGRQLLLALSREKALILADLDDCFISINILLGEQQMSQEALETFARLFDFSISPQPIDIAAANHREAAREAQQERVRLENLQATAPKSYEEYILAHRGDTSSYYTFLDFDGDGIDEMATGFGGPQDYFMLYTLKNGYMEELPFDAYYNGFWIRWTQDGIPVIETTQVHGNQTYFLFLEVDGDTLRYRDFLKLDPTSNADAPWQRCTNAPGEDVRTFRESPMYWEEISQETYNSICDKYAYREPEVHYFAEGAVSATDLYTQFQNRFPDKMLFYIQDDFDNDGVLDLAVMYDGWFRAVCLLDEQGRMLTQWIHEDGFLFYEAHNAGAQPVSNEGKLPGFTETRDGVEYHTFLRILKDGFFLRDCLRYDPNGGDAKWAKAELDSWDIPVESIPEQWKPISQQEYQQLLENYQDFVYEAG